MVATGVQIGENESINIPGIQDQEDPEPTAQDMFRESQPAIKRIKEHLTCFNCFSQDIDPAAEPLDELDEYAKLCTGLSKFQKSMGIPQTGIFDTLTAERLKQPHCHNHDSHKENIFSDNTYKIRKFTYCYDRYPDNYFSVNDVRVAFETAFQEWSRHVVPPLTFVEMPPQREVDIRIEWRYDFDRLPFGDSITPDDSVYEGQPIRPAKAQDVKWWKDDWVAVSYSPSAEHSPHAAEIYIYFKEQADKEFESTAAKKEQTSSILPQIAIHQIGHILGLGHSDVPDAVMWPEYRTATIHEDDIRAIRAKYQPYSTGEYGKWNQILESQPGRVAEIVAAPRNRFYRRDVDGSVWEFESSGKWEQVNYSHLAEQIDANSQYLFLVGRDGGIYRRGRSKVWEQIDSPSKYSKIIRAARNGKELYQLYGEGWVSSFDNNEEDCEWKLLDENTHLTIKTVNIATNASQVFYQHQDGGIHVSNGVYRQCRYIHGPCEIKQLVGAGNWLYRLDKSGQTFEWIGEGQDWAPLDSFKYTLGITAAGSYFYDFSQSGKIWYTNRKDRVVGSRPDHWVQAPKLNTDKIVQLSAADSTLYCLDGDGGIHQIVLENSP